jgi:hypothetical protein
MHCMGLFSGMTRLLLPVSGRRVEILGEEHPDSAISLGGESAFSSWYPFETGYLTLSYTGDPRVNAVSHREGCGNKGVSIRIYTHCV